MVQRMSRDVHNYLPPATNQKRTVGEAFGPSNDLQGAKIKLVSSADNEISRKACECRNAVDEYVQGITKVKEHNSEYRELQPDESVLEELRQKPLSWIG